MIYIVVTLIFIWLCIGYYRLRFEGGWLIMITDKRNTHRTWMTMPALYICVVLWPINKFIARQAFLLSIRK